MTRKLKVISVGVVVAVAVAAGFFLRKPEEAAKQTEPTKEASFLAIPQAPSAAIPIVASASSSSASPSFAVPMESKSSYVDRLSKTGSPSDAFAAYKTIRNCVATRDDQQNVATRTAAGQKPPTETVASACGDLSSAQIAARLQLLSKAMKAGVRGAASSFLDEGPGGYGNGIQRSPDDPELAAFVKESQEAIAIGAAHGDWWSLFSTSGNYEQAGNYTAALQYLVAANDSYQAGNGSDFRSYQLQLERLKAHLTTDQVDPAIQAGHQLYSNAQSVK